MGSSSTPGGTRNSTVTGTTIMTTTATISITITEVIIMPANGASTILTH